jgi:FMN phosphatase YigB (HAD superfamily)
LRGDLPLALVSNGNSAMQRMKLGVCKLENRFDYIFIAQEVGYSKPKPQIYAQAVEAVGVAAQECLMVGDNLEKDIEGAQRAGLQAAWMRRHPDGPTPTDSHADYVIHTMAELQTLLISVNA